MSAEAAARGTEKAQEAVRCMAAGRDDLALAVLNGSTREETTWAAAFLLGALRSVALELHGHDWEKASRALRLAADNPDDAAITAAEVIIDDALRRMSRD